MRESRGGGGFGRGENSRRSDLLEFDVRTTKLVSKRFGDFKTFSKPNWVSGNAKRGDHGGDHGGVMVRNVLGLRT